MWARQLSLAALLLTATIAQADKPDEFIVIRETPPQSWIAWSGVSGLDFVAIADDDIQRQSNDSVYFSGIQIEERYLPENGFRWHLLRFTNTAKPEGPLWMVPHDDENAAFDAMIMAVREYGGVGIAVNSGPGSVRRQVGYGSCGVKPEMTSSCDPNRNFGARTPLFTAAFLADRQAGQPIIALHTNAPGFSGDGHGGRGEITVLDVNAAKRGQISPRAGALFAVNPSAEMANYDTLGLAAYLARNGKPDAAALKCGQAIANAGVHYWHEPVSVSDGSMSNYLILNRPDIAYFNAESRAEIDLAVAAARHKVMIAAYLDGCKKK